MVKKQLFSIFKPSQPANGLLKASKALLKEAIGFLTVAYLLLSIVTGLQTPSSELLIAAKRLPWMV